MGDRPMSNAGLTRTAEEAVRHLCLNKLNKKAGVGLCLYLFSSGQSGSAPKGWLRQVYHGPLNLSFKQLFSAFRCRICKRGHLLSVQRLQPFKDVINSPAANVDVDVHLNEHAKYTSSYCDSGGKKGCGHR
jgi:hypothetical protein